MNQWTVSPGYTEEDLKEYFLKKFSSACTQEQKNKILSLIKTLEEPVCFVADESAEGNSYDLMKDAPSLFLEFASLGNKGSSKSDALTWVRDFGPLFLEPFDILEKHSLLTTKNDEPMWQPGSSRAKSFELEYLWYWTLREPLILKDTVINLSQIASDAVDLWQAIYYANRDLLEKCLSELEGNERLHGHIVELINPVNTDWETVRDTVNRLWLLPMVQHYMTGAVPAFEVNNLKPRRAANTNIEATITGLRFKRTWYVPDQWRAMWVHFYEQLVNNSEVRACEHCKKLFLVTDKRQAYCQPRPGAKRSRCQNAVAVTTFRSPKD